jgi:uncharacterized protein (UPF0335 family)
MTETFSINDYIEDTEQSIEDLTLKLVRDVLNLEAAKKAIDEKISSIKKEAKDKGVDTDKASRMLTALKTKLKMKPGQEEEEKKLLQMFEEDNEIMSQLKILVK